MLPVNLTQYKLQIHILHSLFSTLTSYIVSSGLKIINPTTEWCKHPVFHALLILLLWKKITSAVNEAANVGPPDDGAADDETIDRSLSAVGRSIKNCMIDATFNIRVKYNMAYHI